MAHHSLKWAAILCGILVGCFAAHGHEAPQSSQPSTLWEVAEQIGLFETVSDRLGQPKDHVRVIVRLQEQPGDMLNRDAIGPEKYQALRESVARRQQAVIERFERVLPARMKENVRIVDRLNGVYSIVMEIRSGEALRTIAEDASVSGVMLDEVVTTSNS